MTMTAEIVESVEQIDLAEWNRLVEGRSFADHRWLQLLEALLLNYQPRYVLLRHNGSLMAGAVCSIQNRFHSRLLQSSMGWFLRRFPSMRCDMPIDYNTGLFFSDQERLDEVFPELLCGMQPLFRQENILFYSFDHLSSSGPVWAYLQAHGYYRIDHVFDSNLTICWTAFDDYLKSLPEKENEEYEKLEKYLDRQEITIEAVDPLTEDLAEYQKLVNEESRRNRTSHVYRDDILSRASTLMRKDIKIIVARQKGQVVGCIAMLRSANDWIVRWPGLDSEHTLDSDVFDGLLAECIRQAILLKGHQLGLGILDYQSMRRFGLVAEKWVGAMAVRNRALHWWAGRILGITANRYTSQSPENL
jgi:predicted N-acyltransferase